MLNTVLFRCCRNVTVEAGKPWARTHARLAGQPCEFA
jgi:hypothetical protein